jgi:hypothetical protein
MRRLLFAAALGGCSLVVDLDGLKGAGSPDATSDASDAGDASSDAAIDVKTYAEEVMTDKPSSWWRLGETSAAQAVKDSANNNFVPGVYTDAGVTFGVQGALKSDSNTAITLDGTGAVIMPGTAYILSGNPTFTVEIWASTSGGGAVQRLVSHRTSTAADGWMLFLDSALNPSFQELQDGGFIANLAATSPVTPSKYTHIVVTGDTQNLRLYVNGQLSKTTTQASVPTTAAPGLVLGSSSGVQQEFFKGSLDEAAIYLTCLGADRVLAHYNAALK